MPPGLDSLKHVVVLMMENRSFDHLLGSLKAVDPRIDGLTGDESNPDTNGTLVKVSDQAQYQSQLDPDPNHDFAPVNQQIFNGGTAPTMQGFIASYFEQRRDVKHSRKIMYYFKRGQAAGPDDPGPRVRGVQPVVCVDSRTDAVQPRLRALRHLVRARRHGALLCQPVVQEHLRTAGGGRTHREDLLLRSEELHDGDREPPAEPTAVLRDARAIPR